MPLPAQVPPAPTAAGSDVTAATESSDSRADDDRSDTRRQRDRPQVKASPPPAPVAQAPVAPPSPVAQAPVERPPLAEPSSSVRAGDGRHVVQGGESLWSIARELLGADAGNARIATVVSQLWELNRATIGTGDPDLIRAGQELVLPAGLG